MIEAGRQANGAQRYQCQNEQCVRRIFLLQYQDRGRAPEIRRQVIDMAINGSGIRDTACVLRISPTPVIAIVKKAVVLRHVNPALLPAPRLRAVCVPPGRAAELDKMWSVVDAAVNDDMEDRDALWTELAGGALR